MAEKPVSIPKRHHVLPKNCFFKAFATQHSSDPDDLWVWVHGFGKPSREAHLDSTAVVKHFYTFYDAQGNKDTQLETFLAQIEGKLAPTVHKLIAQSGDAGFTIEEKANVATFVGMMIVRTPQFRQRIDALLKTAKEAFDAHHRGEDAVSVLRRITNAPLETMDFGSVTREQTDAFFSNEVIQDNFHVLALWGQCLKHAKVLYEQMQWTYLTPEAASEFVTCDDPVGRFDEQNETHKEGIANPNVSVYFPISPDLCFYAYHDAMDVVRMHQTATMAINKKEVDLINSRMIISAERDVYSRSQNPDIQSMLDAKNAQLTEDVQDAASPHGS